MNTANIKSLTILQAHCPEIQLGQRICHVVNEEFPHYSSTKFKPLIKRHITEKNKREELYKIIGKMYSYRPDVRINGAQYISDLLPFTEQYRCFNCFESAHLSELLLKINGVENSYTAYVYKGNEDADHVVCFFNRDGSPFDGEIKNNQTIIVDAWAGICDFANNVFKEYEGCWTAFLKELPNKAEIASSKFNFRKISNLSFREDFLNIILNKYPMFKL